MEVRVPKPRASKGVVLEQEELFRYLMAAYAKSPRRAWTLMLTYGIGARRMEVTGIRTLEDMDPVRGVRLRGKRGKERWVPLSEPARVALENLRPHFNGTVLGGIDRGTLSKWAHEAAVDSGLYPKLRRRTAHALRATFATHLLRKGVPVETVRDLLGHESISTTNTYAIGTEEEGKEAVKLLGCP